MQNSEKKEIIFGFIVLLLLVLAGLSYRYQVEIYGYFKPFFNKTTTTVVSADVKLARELIADKRYDEALVILNAFDEAGNADPEIYRLQYATYNLRGDNDNARIAIKKYVDTKPALAEYWLNYINLEKQYGVEPALIYEYYENAIEDVKRNTNKLQSVIVYRSYASYLTGTGEFDEAIKYLNLAKEIDQTSAEFYDSEIQFVLQEKAKHTSNF